MFLRVQFTELIKNIMFFLFQVYDFCFKFQVSGFKLDLVRERKGWMVFFSQKTRKAQKRDSFGMT
jgi:hypothetical protein